jgi:hypothetical protein
MRWISAEARLVLFVASFFALVAAAGAELVSWRFEERVEGVGREALVRAAGAFEDVERTEVEKLSSTLDALMASERLRSAFRRRDREQLLAVAQPIFETMKERDRITHWYFHEPDPSRRVFLRVHRPALHGDRVERATLVKAAETGDLGAGLDLGRTAFALRVVRPWVVGGETVGYMELAEEIGHFLEAMKGRSGDEYGLLLLKAFLGEADWRAVLGPAADTWNARANVVVADATSLADGLLAFDGDLSAVPDRGLPLGEEHRSGRTYLRGVFPLSDAAGRRVGGLFVLHDFTDSHQAVRAGRIDAYLVLLAIAGVAAVGVALLVHLILFRRVHAMRLRLERLASGWAPSQRRVPMEATDDLGRLEALYERALAEAARRSGREPPGDAGAA